MPGFGNQWLGHYLPEFSDASARTILEHVANVSSPFTDVKLVTLGGAVARVGEGETSGKVYVNFMADEGTRHVMDAYEPHTFKRLQAIKAAYDPHNRFRMNQNIGPASNGA